jgi:hypothetical protein
MADEKDSADAPLPVLGEAVEGTGRPVLTAAVEEPLASPELLADLQNELVAKTRAMAEEMLHTALREAEAAVFEQLSVRLSEELPEMVREVLAQRLGR